MFSATAGVYDLLMSAFKDYPAEAAQVAALIRARHPGARTVLDVACGTGEHAYHLTTEHGFVVDGLDLDPEFVEIARRKLPDASVVLGDMTGFSLRKRYDAVVCLFSSIGYVRTLDRLLRTLENFREHLSPGGLILVEPWFAPGVLDEGRTVIRTAEAAGVSICRMSQVRIQDRLSRLHFDYLIGTAEGIQHRSELHELGLFTVDEMAAAFRAAGLEVEHDPVGPCGRGLYTAWIA